MSTRWLKALVALSVGLGLLIVLAWPQILGPNPVRTAPLAERRGYAQRMLAIAGTLLGAVVVGGVAATFIVRRARDEYREAMQRNVRVLVEQAREDRERKREEADG